MSNSKKDPYAFREASKYDNPIASRELILDILEQSSGPLTHSKLAKQLALESDEQLEALRRRLIAMERDGQLMSNRRGAYGRVDKMDLVRGRVQGHRDGFGFVLPADGSEDVYLTYRQMRKVFHGDEVLVRRGPEGFRGRVEGSIVEVLAHNTQQLVGRFMTERGIQFVRPDNPKISHDVMVPADKTAGAKRGQFVSVEITQQPGRNNPPAGHVIEVLGNHLAPGMEIDVAIRSHGIPHLWPSDVEQEVKQFSPEVDEQAKRARKDLRQQPFVTIDGEDARDFDDAVYCEKKTSGGWRLFVAIADVSHYVSVGSALDREALARGNSVYFPDHVVPMLPEVLSNGLCSLNPQVDRLCMVCEMTISAQGKISGYRFYEGLMHSHARLTYTQVGQIIADKNRRRSGIRQQFHSLVPHLDELHNLYQVLREAREQRGAIDFESQETRILFDAQRKIERIIPVDRNDAHKLVEECMLAANVCAARFLSGHQLPCLYRVHEGPNNEKLEQLHLFLRELGISMTFADIPKPQDYQAVLQAIVERPDAHLVQTVMLRSMNQAVYQPKNLGHFGLAYPAYAHFTSPIRRYPDLLVHRAIRSVIRSDTESKRVWRAEDVELLNKETIYPYIEGAMVDFGEQCSMTERRADEATRDVVSWLKCEYLQERVGEVFAGVVSSVTGFGVFVELKNLYVEGLVHITALPEDYYHHEPAHHRLVGERTRKMFRLGDELSVRVVRVDLDERKVDLDLVGVQAKKRNKIRVSSKAKEMAGEYKSALSKKASKKNTKKQTGKAKKAQSKKKKKSKKQR